MQTFIKTVNYNHMMPTRYTLDLDLKNVGPDVLENTTKKVEARKVSGVWGGARVSARLSGLHRMHNDTWRMGQEGRQRGREQSAQCGCGEAAGHACARTTHDAQPHDARHGSS